MAEEIEKEYHSSLVDLSFNSKPLINMLTVLAEENVAHAPVIVQTIEKHLAKTDHKLPCLYLVDSILKNVGKAYIQLFTQNIVSTFAAVFEKVDEKTRSALFRLRQTWTAVFAPRKLYAIDLRVNGIDPAWPVVQPPSESNTIHINPKVFNKKSSSSSSSSSSAPAPAAAAAPSSDLILEKQMELLALQIQKVELELQCAPSHAEKVQKQRELLDLRTQKAQLELQQATRTQKAQLELQHATSKLKSKAMALVRGEAAAADQPSQTPVTTSSSSGSASSGQSKVIHPAKVLSAAPTDPRSGARPEPPAKVGGDPRIKRTTADPRMAAAAPAPADHLRPDPRTAAPASPRPDPRTAASVDPRPDPRTRGRHDAGRAPPAAGHGSWRPQQAHDGAAKPARTGGGADADGGESRDPRLQRPPGAALLPTPPSPPVIRPADATAHAQMLGDGASERRAAHAAAVEKDERRAKSADRRDPGVWAAGEKREKGERSSRSTERRDKDERRPGSADRRGKDDRAGRAGGGQRATKSAERRDRDERAGKPAEKQDKDERSTKLSEKQDRDERLMHGKEKPDKDMRAAKAPGKHNKEEQVVKKADKRDKSEHKSSKVAAKRDRDERSAKAPAKRDEDENAVPGAEVRDKDDRFLVLDEVSDGEEWPGLQTDEKSDKDERSTNQDHDERLISGSKSRPAKSSVDMKRVKDDQDNLFSSIRSESEAADGRKADKAMKSDRDHRIRSQSGGKPADENEPPTKPAGKSSELHLSPSKGVKDDGKRASKSKDASPRKSAMKTSPDAKQPKEKQRSSPKLSGGKNNVSKHKPAVDSTRQRAVGSPKPKRTESPKRKRKDLSPPAAGSGHDDGGSSPKRRAGAGRVPPLPPPMQADDELLRSLSPVSSDGESDSTELLTAGSPPPLFRRARRARRRRYKQQRSSASPERPPGAGAPPGDVDLRLGAPAAGAAAVATSAAVSDASVTAADQSPPIKRRRTSAAGDDTAQDVDLRPLATQQQPVEPDAKPAVVSDDLDDLFGSEDTDLRFVEPQSGGTAGGGWRQLKQSRPESFLSPLRARANQLTAAAGGDTDLRVPVASAAGGGGGGVSSAGGHGAGGGAGVAAARSPLLPRPRVARFDIDSELRALDESNEATQQSIQLILHQSEEQLRAKNISLEQYNKILEQVIQLGERQKVREQRSLERRRSMTERGRRSDSVSSAATDADERDREPLLPPPAQQPQPPLRGDDWDEPLAPVSSLAAGGRPPVWRRDAEPAPQRPLLPRPGPGLLPVPGAGGGGPQQQPAPRQPQQPFGADFRDREPQRGGFGPRFGGISGRGGAVRLPLPQPYDDDRAPAAFRGRGAGGGARGRGRGALLMLPSGGGPPLPMPMPNRFDEFEPTLEPELPQASADDLAAVERDKADATSTYINDDPKEIRWYGENCVVLLSWDDPRALRFKAGMRHIVLDDQRVPCHFNDKYTEILVDGVKHHLRLGAPTKEVFLDGHGYQVYFGGEQIQVPVDGRTRALSVDGPAPGVEIGPPRLQLLAGKIRLVVDGGSEQVAIYLDCKPQRFEVAGKAHILRFRDGFERMSLNGQIFHTDFGGLPLPVVVGGRKHYIRLTNVPAHVKPGRMTMKGMLPAAERFPPPWIDQQLHAPAPEQQQQQLGVDLSQPPPGMAPFRPEVGRGRGGVRGGRGGALRGGRLNWDGGRPPPHGQSASAPSSSALDMLANIMPMTVSKPSGPSYRAENPGHALAPGAAGVDLNDLLSKLQQSGLIRPGTTAAAGDDAAASQKEQEIKDIKQIDWKVDSLRVRQPGIINLLYSGIQCSSCGSRFLPEQTVQYSNHLDWHFRQNKREKEGARRAQSRKWYYDVASWMLYEEFEDADDRVEPAFEQPEPEAAEEPEDESLCSAPVGSTEADNRCQVCGETFRQFYHEESEEWHLRDCIRVEGRAYHPACFEDHKTTLLLQSLRQESTDNETSVETSAADLTLTAADDDERPEAATSATEGAAAATEGATAATEGATREANAKEGEEQEREDAAAVQVKVEEDEVAMETESAAAEAVQKSGDAPAAETGSEPATTDAAPAAADADAAPAAADADAAPAAADAENAQPLIPAAEIKVEPDDTEMAAGAETVAADGAGDATVKVETMEDSAAVPELTDAAAAAAEDTAEKSAAGQGPADGGPPAEEMRALSVAAAAEEDAGTKDQQPTVAEEEAAVPPDQPPTAAEERSSSSTEQQRRATAGAADAAEAAAPQTPPPAESTDDEPSRQPSDPTSAAGEQGSAEDQPTPAAAAAEPNTTQPDSDAPPSTVEEIRPETGAAAASSAAAESEPAESPAPAASADAAPQPAQLETAEPAEKRPPAPRAVTRAMAKQAAAAEADAPAQQPPARVEEPEPPPAPAEEPEPPLQELTDAADGGGGGGGAAPAPGRIRLRLAGMAEPTAEEPRYSERPAAASVKATLVGRQLTELPMRRAGDDEESGMCVVM